MTNTELIQAIRNKIERLKGIGGIVPLDNREQKTGYESALIDIETFLSTLESEKPSDGLEEEYKDYVESDPVYSKLVNRYAGLSIARHFAQWGAEHYCDLTKKIGDSSEIPNHLNVMADYARRQTEELLDVIKKYDDYSDEQIEELRTHLMAMFLEGAGWQEKQMLKEAVPFYEIIKAVPPGPERDNTRIIIVKQD